MRLLRVLLTTLMLLSLALLPAAAAGCRCHDSHGEVSVEHSQHEGPIRHLHVSSHCPAHHDGARSCGMMCCAAWAFSLAPVATALVRVCRAELVMRSADDPQRDGLPSSLSLRPPIAA